MSFCTPCTSFGSWLLTKSTEDAIRFYKTLRPNTLYTIYDPRKDQRLAFSHHTNNQELLQAARSGCPLCSLIVDLRAARLTTHFGANNTGNSKHLFFQVDAASLKGKLYYGVTGKGGYVALDIYSKGAASDIWVSGVHRNSNPLAENAKIMVNGWVKECLLRHKECNAQSGYLPTRILNVGPADGTLEPYLVETKDLLLGEDTLGSVQTNDGPQLELLESGAQSRYAALSHCWGTTEHSTTTQDTLLQRKTCIPMSTLNKTFADAVTVTRALDLRYLWIDSLCIIQDSVNDWEKESAKMCSVYSSAIVNITATSAKDGNEGFLHERPFVNMCSMKPATCTAPMSCLVADFYIRSAHEYAQSLEGSELFSRAWCYQENMLTPRVLSFERSNISFACRVKSYKEDPHTYSETKRISAIGFSRAISQPIKTEDDRRKAYKLWQDIVSEYSQKALTFEKDKLPALAGLASQFGDATGDRYLAGLWEGDLLAGLCWTPPGGTWERRASSSKTKEYRAPTWSWASQLHAVHYFSTLSERHWDAKVLGCSVEVTSNPYGQVRNGSLGLKAKLLEAKLYCSTSADRNNPQKGFCVFAAGSSEPSRLNFDFNPDDENEVFSNWDVKVWCCHLGGSNILVLKNLDSDGVYERIGFVSTWTEESTWRGSEWKKITII